MVFNIQNIAASTNRRVITPTVKTFVIKKGMLFFAEDNRKNYFHACNCGKNATLD